MFQNNSMVNNSSESLWKDVCVCTFASNSWKAFDRNGLLLSELLKLQVICMALYLLSNLSVTAISFLHNLLQTFFFDFFSSYIIATSSRYTKEFATHHKMISTSYAFFVVWGKICACYEILKDINLFCSLFYWELKVLS